jgi:hypothetical protein
VGPLHAPGPLLPSVDSYQIQQYPVVLELSSIFHKPFQKEVLRASRASRSHAISSKKAVRIMKR